jgi:hypothetical protein
VETATAQQATARRGVVEFMGVFMGVGVVDLRPFVRHRRTGRLPTEREGGEGGYVGDGGDSV